MTDIGYRTCPRRLVGLIAGVFMLALFGCETSGKSSQPEAIESPTQTQEYKYIAVGKITGANADLSKRSVYLGRELTLTLRDEGQFSRVYYPAPDPLPEDTLLISGELTSLSEGDKGMRFVFGFGAGAAEATGSFRLSDRSGTSLAAFERSSTYEGEGMDEAETLDVNYLVKRLGRDTARAVIRWKQGKSLTEP